MFVYKVLNKNPMEWLKKENTEIDRYQDHFIRNEILFLKNEVYLWQGVEGWKVYRMKYILLFIFSHMSYTSQVLHLIFKISFRISHTEGIL